jgi:hypothetical protein
VRRLLASSFFWLLLPSLALAAAGDRPRTVNLDSDPAPETVVAEKLCESTDGSLVPPAPTCGVDQFPRRRVKIEDTCGGQPTNVAISSTQDFVDRLRVTEADGATARPETFFDLRSGATGRGGDIRVVRYDDVVGACPQPRDLFRYPSKRTLGPIPKGAFGRDSFSVAVRNFSKRYRGKEVRVRETYVDRNDAFCCPSFERRTFFRFNRKLDRYARYQSSVKRIKARGKKP